MTVKSSISLSDRQHAFASSLVESGRFGSVSAVVQQGLELLRDRMDTERADTESLKLILADRRAGTFLSPDEFDRQLETMLGQGRSSANVED